MPTASDNDIIARTGEQLKCIQEVIVIAKLAWAGHQGAALLTGDHASSITSAMPPVPPQQAPSTPQAQQSRRSRSVGQRASDPALVPDGRAIGQRLPFAVALPAPEISPVIDSPAASAFSARFSRQRAEYPPVDPAAVMESKMQPGWQPRSSNEVYTLGFNSTKLDNTWEDQVWEWLGALAYSDIRVLEYYDGFVDRNGHGVQHNAFMKGEADGSVVCVRHIPSRVTLNWFLSRDGFVRLDGGGLLGKQTVLTMLRDTHVPWVAGNTQHGNQTGRQADIGKVARARFKTDLQERAKWELEQKNIIFQIAAAEVFDGNGVAGIWDVLNDHLGVKTIPRGTSIPYLLILSPGQTLTIHKDGRIVIGMGTGSIQEARRVKTILAEKFHGKDIPAAEYRRSAPTDRVRYGTQGVLARERAGASVFHSGGTSRRW